MNRSNGIEDNTERNQDPGIGEKRKRNSSSAGERPAKITRLLDPNRGKWDISTTGRVMTLEGEPKSETIRELRENFKTLPIASKRIFTSTGEKKGEGTYGIVFKVSDTSKPQLNIVMKISVVDKGFFSEVLALTKLAKYGLTPNIPKIYTWFISDQLPPQDGAWSSVNDVIARSSQFRKSTSSSHSSKLYGYIVMENAEGGTLASFFQHYRDRSPSVRYTWYTIDVTMFQLIYSVAVLPHCGLLHRDLGGSNNILVGFLPPASSPETSDWWFAVGDQQFCFPQPTFKPMMIDYGTAKHLVPRESLKTDFRYTTLRYRAPELIFISDTPSGRLQPWYMTTTDLFSIGMTILEIILGDFCKRDKNTPPENAYECHPFMKYKCPRDLPKRIEDLYESLVEREKKEDLSTSERRWAGMLRKGFIDKGESKLLARYLWGMYHELGVPSNDIWPGIENTHIWRLMNDVIQERKNAGQNIPPFEGRLFEDPTLREYLSEQQRNLLRDILQYNPKRRPDVIKVLQSEIFAHLRAKTPSSTKIKWSIPAKNVLNWPSES